MISAKRMKEARLESEHSKSIDISNSDFSTQTALQVYCQAYKQAPVGQAHALLRKARRLDSILNLRSSDSQLVVPPPPSTPTSGDPECYRCHSQFSPAFYRVTDSSLALNGHRNGEEVWMCHRCHFELNETNSGKSMGMMVS